VKKRIKKILLVIIILFIVLFIGLSGFIGFQVFSASTQLVTNEETKGISTVFSKDDDTYYEHFRNTYSIEKLKINSTFDEHSIPADYIYTEESQNSKNHQTVILIHGLGDNRYSNYPIAEFFLDKGYNVITYDQRSTNENTAKYTTFGYFEKYDLIDWINYVENQAPEQKIGVWGASFGGATAGLAIGYKNIEEKIDFLILDSPVSSMKWMVEDEMRNMNTGLPVNYLSWCGSIVNKLKLGFTYQDTDVVESLKDVKVPVLIINSKVDTLTPYFMGKDIYDVIPKNNRQIWTVDDSEHCEMWIDHNQEYRNKVENFLMNYGVIPVINK